MTTLNNDSTLTLNIVTLVLSVLTLLVVIFILFNQRKNSSKLRLAKLFQKKKNVVERVYDRQEVCEKVAIAVQTLSKTKTGALITIEGQESLDSFINKSIVIRSVITQELLTTLFYVGTATHDGAVIIRRNTIMCAGAYLPSTDRYDIPKSLGTRHRAAIGISEITDSVTVVVSEETGSEETGKISITRNGGIEIGLSKEDLKKLLETHIAIK